MRKKILSMITALCMSVSIMAVPSVASAEESGSIDDNITWELDDNGTLTISGTGAFTSPTYGREEPWGEKSKVKSLVINDGITELENYSFYDYENLETITFPSTLKHIGSDSFNNLPKVNHLHFPEGLETIEMAFDNCPKLTDITLPSTIKMVEAFGDSGYSKDKNNWQDGVLYIGDVMIDTSYDDKYGRAEKYNFGDVYHIKDGVRVITDNAFASFAQEINTVYVPDSVKYVTGCAFENTKVVVFTGDMPEFMGRASYEPFKRNSVVFYPENNPTWTEEKIQNAKVSSGVKFISGMPESQPATSGKCGDNLTWELKNYRTLVIKGTGDMYDYNDENSVPWQAWSDYLTTVEFNEGITSINGSAFKSLWRVYNGEPDDFDKIKINENSGIDKEYVDFVVSKIKAPISGQEQSDQYYKYDISCTLDTDGTLTVSGSGYYPYELLKKSRLDYTACVKKVIVNEGVTGLYNPAFPNMTEISLPETVETMPSFTYATSLKKVNIPNSVKSVSNTFDYTLIYDDESNWDGDLLYLGGWLITGRNENKNVIVKPGTRGIGGGMNCAENVVLPVGLKYIGGAAFRYCPAETLAIPKSVEDIETAVFMGATIQNVYYEGSEEEWNKIYGDKEQDGYSEISKLKAQMHFNAKMPAVTVQAQTGGTAVGGGKYLEGASVTLTAAPQDGYKFDGWYVGNTLVSEETEYSFTAENDVTAVAKFTSTAPAHKGGGSLGGSSSGSTGGSDAKTDTKDDRNNTKDDSNKTSNTITLKIGQVEANIFGEKKTNDVAPIIRNDRTMLPARLVAESLGATVAWDGDKRLVTIIGKNEKDEDVEILITIGAESAIVNGEDTELDSPAFIENDRTYTPIRFIAELLGANVDWNAEMQEVIITRK